MCYNHSKKSSACQNESSKTKKSRRVKFLGDLVPEEFNTPEAYEVVQKYTKKHKKQIHNLQRTIN